MAKPCNFIMFALLALLALLSVCVGDVMNVSPVRGPDPETNYHRHHTTSTRHFHTGGPPSTTTHIHSNGHLPSNILPRGEEHRKHISESSHNHRTSHHHHTAPTVTTRVQTNSQLPSAMLPRDEDHHKHHTPSTTTVHIAATPIFGRDEQRSPVWSHQSHSSTTTSRVHHSVSLTPQQSLNSARIASMVSSERHMPHTISLTPEQSSVAAWAKSIFDHPSNMPSTVTVDFAVTSVFGRDEQLWSAWSHSTPTSSHVSRTIGLGPMHSSIVSVPTFSKPTSMATVTSTPSPSSCATDDPLCSFITGLNGGFVRDIPHPTVAPEPHSIESESESSTSFHFGPGLPHQTEPKPNQHTHKWTWITSYTWADSTTQPATPAPLATFSGNMCVDC